MTEEIYDIGVIGGGPGGYVAAIRAAQLGGKVVLVEKDKLGGTCTHVGCIPTKALLKSVELLSEVKRAEEFGIFVKDVAFDFKKLMERKNTIVNRLSEGIKYLLEANGVKVVKGKAVITSPKELKVFEDETSKRFDVEVIIIATGSRPKLPPIQGVGSRNVLTSDQLLNIEEPPEGLLVVGGGPEGCELATIFSKLGSRVTIVEMLPHLLPFEDQELGMRLAQVLKREGISIYTSTTVEKISDEDEKKKVVISYNGKKEELKADMVLMATGREPNIEGIGLEELGIKYEKTGIVVDERMETNVRDIYAIGDVAGGGLAHVASEEGIIAAENAMGEDVKVDLRVVPRCIYTMPEVAAVGLTEAQAREKGYEVGIGRFPFTASGRALTLGDTRGTVKIIFDKRSFEVLGVHIFGPQASELIPEAALAMKLRAKLQDIVNTMHPHPTLSEGLREAALDGLGSPIHTVRR